MCYYNKKNDNRCCHKASLTSVDALSLKLINSSKGGGGGGEHKILEDARDEIV